MKPSGIHWLALSIFGICAVVLLVAAVAVAIDAGSPRYCVPAKQEQGQEQLK